MLNDGVGAGALAEGVRTEGVGSSLIVSPVSVCGPENETPFSRLTSFLGVFLPAKKSAAVEEGSMEGAGG